MLCKCSGKYIDIYFNLKITFHNKINFNILTCILNYSRPPTPLMCYRHRIDCLKGMERSILMDNEGVIS